MGTESTNISPSAWANWLTTISQDEDKKIVKTNGKTFKLVNSSELSKGEKALSIDQIVSLTSTFWNKGGVNLKCQKKMTQALRTLSNKEEDKYQKLGFFAKLFNSGNEQYADRALQIRDYEQEIHNKEKIRETERFTKGIVAIVQNPNHRIPTEFSNPVCLEMFHFGLNHVIHPELDKANRMFPPGMYRIDYSYNKAEYTRLLLKEVLDGKIPLTPEEKRALVNLCQHQDNVLKYASKINLGWEKLETPEDMRKHDTAKFADLTKEIQKNVDLLDDPDSAKVNILKDGSSSFSVPGGWLVHAMNYEFLKKGDDYYFVVHNSQPQTRSNLHGFVTFKDDEGKTYCKTRVPIKVPKEVLKDPLFIQSLIDGTEEGSGKVYDFIHDFLISSGLGTITKSENEVLLEKLHEQYLSPYLDLAEKEKIKKEALTLMKSDPNFHTEQIYSSCVETCMTTVEKDIAPGSLLKKLKQFTLANMINQVVNPEKEGERSAITVRHARLKLDKLNTQLTHPRISKSSTPPDISSIHKLLEKNNSLIERNKINKDFVPQFPVDSKLLLAEFRNHPKEALKIIQKNGLAIKDCSEAIKSNDEISNVALRQNGLALEFLSKDSQDNKEKVLMAIRNNAYAYKFASERLKKDPEVMLAAIAQDFRIFKDIRSELKVQESFLVSVMRTDSRAIKFLSEDLRKNKNIARAAIDQASTDLTYVQTLAYLPEELKNDRDFILSMIPLNKYLIQYLSPTLKENELIILENEKHHPPQRHYHHTIRSKILKDEHHKKERERASSPEAQTSSSLTDKTSSDSELESFKDPVLSSEEQIHVFSQEELEAQFVAEQEMNRIYSEAQASSSSEEDFEARWLEEQRINSAASSEAQVSSSSEEDFEARWLEQQRNRTSSPEE